LPESDSALNTGSAEETETESVPVELDKEHIALYRGSREYQAITVEQYLIGICQLVSPSYWGFYHLK